MTFQSGVTAAGSGPHTALTVLVAAVLVGCVTLFLGMLAREVWNSVRFARRQRRASVRARTVLDVPSGSGRPNAGVPASAGTAAGGPGVGAGQGGAGPAGAPIKAGHGVRNGVDASPLSPTSAAGTIPNPSSGGASWTWNPLKSLKSPVGTQSQGAAAASGAAIAVPVPSSVTVTRQPQGGAVGRPIQSHAVPPPPPPPPPPLLPLPSTLPGPPSHTAASFRLAPTERPGEASAAHPPRASTARGSSSSAGCRGDLGGADPEEGGGAASLSKQRNNRVLRMTRAVSTVVTIQQGAEARAAETAARLLGSSDGSEGSSGGTCPNLAATVTANPGHPHPVRDATGGGRGRACSSEGPSSPASQV
jgi:hypothetical protein